MRRTSASRRSLRPSRKNSRTYKDDKVSVYAIDMVEPVCCAAGVAVVIPDVDR